MGQVIVRNLDERVVAALKKRAAAKGVSLEQHLREVLTRAAEPGRDEILSALARSRSLTPAGRRTRAEEVVREVRESE